MLALTAPNDMFVFTAPTDKLCSQQYQTDMTVQVDIHVITAPADMFIYLCSGTKPICYVPSVKPMS